VKLLGEGGLKPSCLGNFTPMQGAGTAERPSERPEAARVGGCGRGPPPPAYGGPGV